MKGKNMKKILLIALSMLMAMNCSGCATLLGGIIGYQSGEAVAGAAIGAAIDIAGGISNSNKEKERKLERKEREKEEELERKESINIYTEEGYIRVGSISTQGRNFGDSLKNRFDSLGWKYTETTDTEARETRVIKRVIECTTTDNKEFTLELLREDNQDLLVFIKPDEPNTEFQSMITSQIGIWIRDIAGQ